MCERNKGSNPGEGQHLMSKSQERQNGDEVGRRSICYRSIIIYGNIKQNKN